MTEANFVAATARAWAAGDPVERWVNAAEGRTPLEETIREYLAGHDPFPGDSGVDARWDEAWKPAVVIERTGLDEWLVEFAAGGQAWRDHHELRPRNLATLNAEPDAARLSGVSGRGAISSRTARCRATRTTAPCAVSISATRAIDWVVAILR